MPEPPAIRIDHDRCMGSGICAFVAPNVFALDEASGLARVLDPGGDPLEDVQEAADACPTQAIVAEPPPARS
jgi:ferredoxin